MRKLYLPQILGFLLSVTPLAIYRASAQEFAEKSLDQSQVLYNEEKFAKCVEKIDESLDAIQKDERIHTPDELAPLHYLRAQAHSKLGNFESAMKDYREAAAGDPTNEDFLNGAAWLACTCPNAEIRDGRYALAKAEKAIQLLEKQLQDLSDQDRGFTLLFQREGIANVYDTQAAALAETGDFLQAVKVQKYAVELLTLKGNPFLGSIGSNVSQTTLRDFESRLELYRTKKPYRQKQ
jgi:tetratricopeptide (TPR) repeat protein